MLSASLNIKNFFPNIKAKANDETVKSLYRAGAYIRSVAKRSIRKTNAPASGAGAKNSKPGKPPLSHGPKHTLKNSIRFDPSRIKRFKSVTVGPASFKTDGFGKFHEFGLQRGQTKFKKRPFMGPAIEKAIPKLPEQFINII